MDKVRVIEIKQSVFKNNDEQAEKLRGELKSKGVFLLNLMSSPGSGKTTTLKATINALKDKLKIGVMEADIDSDTGKLKNGYLVPAQTQTIELGDRIDSLPLGIEADHTGLVLIYPYHMLPSDISDSPSCYFNTNDHDVMLDGIKNLMTEKGFHVGEYSISDPYEIEQKNRNTVLVINVFTYGFIVLISLIAIANAFHTISTNLLLRRRDFAMLKSMGMTEKGMHRMLNYECLIYGSRALMYGLPIGFLTNVCIARITSSIYRGGFRMPVIAYLLSIICVFVVVFVTMLYAMKKMRQDNPVEVLKNENL